MEIFKEGEFYRNVFGDKFGILKRTEKTILVRDYHAGSTVRKKIAYENNCEVLFDGVGIIKANILY